MDERPPRQQDPLALAIFGAALALLAGLLLYVFFFKAPEPAPPVAVPGSSLEAGRTWRYAVVVEPPAWRDITLTYRTQREGAGIGVLTDFVHAGGKMNFHLGTYAAGHPSHANTRFPGFFMHASYLPPSL